MCYKKIGLTHRPRVRWDVGPEYEIIRQTGSGTHGTVCEAVKINSGEKVAIKRISGIFDSPIICRRYLREIYILRHLHHPNVVSIKAIIRPKDLNNFNELYIVLDYAPSDLKKLIKSPISLKEDHIQLILYNLLCGLNYIHSTNLLHRDLKPANILFYSDCEVKICDFGLARSLSPSDQMVQSPYEESQTSPISCDSSPTLRRTLTNHVVTRWYRAPELILLEKNYGKPVDIWSLGCILAELCEMVEGNKLAYRHRAPLLKGDSCYPLSPNGSHDLSLSSNDKVYIDSSDQMSVILRLTGTPSAEEVGFITDENSIEYLRSFPKFKGENLFHVYPHSSSIIVNMMKEMLKFDPRDRIMAKQALYHPYFDSIRDQSKEIEANFEILSEFEDIEDISEEKLRPYFIKEILRYCPS